MNEKHFQLEGQLQNLQQKNQEQETAYASLWQQLCKSREREQQLEQLLSAVCLSAMDRSGQLPQQVLKVLAEDKADKQRQFTSQLRRILSHPGAVNGIVNFIQQARPQ